MVTEQEHEQAQKEFFNKVCYEWNKTFDSHRKEQDALVAEIGLKGNERILDVATGIGVMVPSPWPRRGSYPTGTQTSCSRT